MHNNESPNRASAEIVAFPATHSTAVRTDMTHPLIDQVTRYWDGLRQGRVVPTREEVDPRAIQSALPNAFIVDRPRPGTVRFRLSGMHLNDVLGMEARGMPLRSLCEVAYRARLMDQVERVFEEPAMVVIDLRADRGILGIVKAKLALLPLRSGAGAIDRALGVLVTDGIVHDGPTRFATRGFAVTSLRAGVKASDTATRQLLPAGLAEDRNPFDGAPPALPDRLIPGVDRNHLEPGRHTGERLPEPTPGVRRRSGPSDSGAPETKAHPQPGSLLDPGAAGARGAEASTGPNTDWLERARLTQRIETAEQMDFSKPTLTVLEGGKP